MCRDIDRVFLEHGKRNDVQRPLVGRREYHVRGGAVAVSTQPVHRCYAPAIAWHKTREVVLGNRRAQVIADAPLVRQELSGYHRADCVAAEVLWAGPAAAITVEPGHRIAAARFKLAAEHVFVDHASSIRAADMPANDGAPGFAAHYIDVVTFNVTADSYGQFMGRFSEPMAAEFAEFAGVRGGERALDVGSGPGALTAWLVERLGVGAVAAIDPSDSFVAALRARLPGVDMRSGVAEQLPFADDAFDVALAQLVVHFMADPVAGLAEMARVTRPGGVVAACVWDHAGGTGPLATFWRAVHDVDPAARDESHLAGAREGHLTQLCDAAGLRRVESSSLTVSARFATFADWWKPLTLGVGPAGAYVSQLDDDWRGRLRARCEQLLPPAPFPVTGTAWCVRAHP